VPGLVDAHAHPTVAGTHGGPVPVGGAEALDVLAGWAAGGCAWYAMPGHRVGRC